MICFAVPLHRGEPMICFVKSLFSVVRICPVLIAIFGCLQYALFVSVVHNVMLYMCNYLLCSTFSSIPVLNILIGMHICACC
jgi:hypothetical protein